jgi:PIN domain nuclease of toxin-antitoxin system
MTYITDTHPLVWLIEGNARLSSAALSVLSDAGIQVIVPTLVLAEISFLYHRGRIPVDLDTTLAHIRGAGNCVLHPLDEQVASLLPAGLDIHDGIIVATALMHRDHLGQQVSLITRDAAITASGLIPTVW